MRHQHLLIGDLVGGDPAGGHAVRDRDAVRRPTGHLSRDVPQRDARGNTPRDVRRRLTLAQARYDLWRILAGRLERRRMIGLKRGTVQVVPYRADWPNSFEQERRVLREHIGRHVLDIQHVGSTAVPGLDAKPIIDIAVGLASLSVIPRCRQPLCGLGYIDRGDSGTDGGYLFVKESAPEVRTHHLHMVTMDDPQWSNYLRFRDMLRADDDLRTRYSELKNRLQEQVAQDRTAYTKAKQDFFRGLLMR
jgi:GrpB-like predicted nucleotidyltransferase (UPF0157 family)